MDAQHVFPLIFCETENDVVVLFIVIFSPLTGLREWFSQSDESQVLPRIPVMVNMTPSASSKKGRKAQENTTQTSLPMDPSRHSTVLEEESDEDDEFLIPESEQEVDELLIVFFQWTFYVIFKTRLCFPCSHLPVRMLKMLSSQVY